MKRLLIILVAVASFLLPASAANTKTTVSQVTESITLTDDVDYLTGESHEKMRCLFQQRGY